MSGEFRDTHGYYFHSQIASAGEEITCRSEISAALTKVYAALAPVEGACAWYEACDSGPSYPVLTLQEQWSAIEAAFQALKGIRDADRNLIEGLLRNKLSG
jgi:hypothetical protein